jgi:parvulin-like peptidyl-prolyl isomerase
MVERFALVAKAERDGIANEYETQRRYETLLIARLRHDSIDTATKQISITDDELNTEYQKRLPEFTRSAIDRFAILFQEADAKSSDTHRDEARKRLEQGLAQAEASPATGGRGPAASGFGAAAIDFSDDQISRYRGGDIGWVAAGDPLDRIPDQVLEIGRLLKKGSRSEVIETEGGYYVIQKTDSRPGGARPLEEVAVSLRQKLLREKQQELELTFVADALKSASATIDTSAAKQVDLPAPSTTQPISNTPPSFPSANR